MPVGDRVDPYLDFRFLVEIDSLVVAGFSEVSGLEMDVQTETYREGGVNAYAHTLPTRTAYPNLVLRRGLTDSQALWTWAHDAMNGNIERRNGRVVLLDSTGEESWAWEFRDAYPVKWAGPDLDAARGRVAIETLELTHRGLSKVEGVP